MVEEDGTGEEEEELKNEREREVALNSCKIIQLVTVFVCCECDDSQNNSQS